MLVPTRSVKPAQPRWNHEQRQQERRNNEEIDNSQIQTLIRPRRGAKIRFQEEGEFEGKVTRVGKASGKERN